jgi:glycosyltransferase involved in cell wall biosynthesis
MNGTDESVDGEDCIPSGSNPVVWFEVEDFLRYFDHFGNPTGLQRVPFEIFAEAERLYGRAGRVRFCRLSVYTKQFRQVDFGAIISAYLNPPGAGAPWKTVWAPVLFWSELRTMLPVIIRHPRFFFWIFKSAIRDVIEAPVQRRHFERLVRPGDIVVSLGASWGFPRYGEHIAEAKRRYGIRFAILAYDIIPIENESFVEKQHVLQFRTWFRETIPHADVVLTGSKYSRDALLNLAVIAKWSLPRVEIIELGAGLNDRPIAGNHRKAILPPRYVLFVSTIEIRKNHQLLVRVWRQLLERHGAGTVPVLIFAGQIGWLVDDLLADLAASAFLGGKIELMTNWSDAELRQAYRSCLFTVYPSFCEGWGLPIAESLAHGKFCVASNRTSIPEVGGDLIDYFDPSDDNDALARIERLLIDPGYLAKREARLQAEYRPRTWADCAHALIDTLTRSKPADKAQ